MHATKKQGGEEVANKLEYITENWSRLPRRTQLWVIWKVWRGVAQRKLDARLFNPD